MKMTKAYYYTLYEMLLTIPYAKLTFTDFLKTIFDVSTVEDLSAFQLPANLSDDEAIYNEFFSLVVGRYTNDSIFKLIRMIDEEAPSSTEVTNAFIKWGYKFVSLLNLTYEYYVPLLKFYRSAKNNLMDDIEAVSSNTVKFNDTPQNNNSTQVYEGDDYITHFTKTENVSKSPLVSKINRLKEIQDDYKNVLADWVKEFEKLFLEIK